MAKLPKMIFVLSTTPDKASAEKIANVLLEKRLCACVNSIPGVRSLFRWEGKMESQEECLLLIKTRKELFKEIAQAIKVYHPYTVPEIVSLDVQEAQSDFLAWLIKETAARP